MRPKREMQNRGAFEMGRRSAKANAVSEVKADSEPNFHVNSKGCAMSFKAAGKCSYCGVLINSPGSPQRALHRFKGEEFCALCCKSCRDGIALDFGF
jgi:hypothetical protein